MDPQTSDTNRQPLADFPQFALLPPELQRMIWKEAIISDLRILELDVSLCVYPHELPTASSPAIEEETLIYSGSFHAKSNLDQKGNHPEDRSDIVASVSLTCKTSRQVVLDTYPSLLPIHAHLDGPPCWTEPCWLDDQPGRDARPERLVWLDDDDRNGWLSVGLGWRATRRQMRQPCLGRMVRVNYETDIFCLWPILNHEARHDGGPEGYFLNIWRVFRRWPVLRSRADGFVSALRRMRRVALSTGLWKVGGTGEEVVPGLLTLGLYKSSPAQALLPGLHGLCELLVMEQSGEVASRCGEHARYFVTDVDSGCQMWRKADELAAAAAAAFSDAAQEQAIMKAHRFADEAWRLTRAERYSRLVAEALRMRQSARFLSRAWFGPTAQHWEVVRRVMEPLLPGQVDDRADKRTWRGRTREHLADDETVGDVDAERRARGLLAAEMERLGYHYGGNGPSTQEGDVDMPFLGGSREITCRQLLIEPLAGRDSEEILARRERLACQAENESAVRVR